MLPKIFLNVYVSGDCKAKISIKLRKSEAEEGEANCKRSVE